MQKLTYRFSRAFFPVPIVSVITLTYSMARLTNVTIDDTFGDPITGEQIQYTPSNAWKQGNGCQTCSAKPTPASDSWMGTWHDATFYPNDTSTNSAIGQVIQASVQFTGTAVYVNCILTRSFTSPDGNTDMTFFLDDLKSGVFQESPNGDTTYYFGVSVFNATGLANTSHTLRLEAGLAGLKALVLLDSIVYTMDDGVVDATSTGTSIASSTPTTHTQDKKTNVGVIVVPIIAALALVIGLVAGVLYYRRRRRDGKVPTSYGRWMITPFSQHVSHSHHAQSAPPSEPSTCLTPATSFANTGGPNVSTIARVQRPSKKISGKWKQGAVGVPDERHHRPLPGVTEGRKRAAPSTSTPSAPSWPDTRKKSGSETIII